MAGVQATENARIEPLGGFRGAEIRWGGAFGGQIVLVCDKCRLDLVDVA